MASKAVPGARMSQPAPSKPPCTIHSTAIVADKAQLTGTYPIEIGENTVIHPYAKIRSEGGKVVIGSNCLVYERAVVGCEKSDGSGDADVVLGDYVTVDTSAVVEAKTIGEGAEIGIKASVARNTVVGKWCKICPLERVETGEELPDFMVVYGDGQRRVDKTMEGHDEVRSTKKEAQVKAVEVMRKLVPNASAKWMG